MLRVHQEAGMRAAQWNGAGSGTCRAMKRLRLLLKFTHFSKNALARSHLQVANGNPRWRHSSTAFADHHVALIRR